MKGRYAFALGLVSGIGLISCAGVSFNYAYFGLSAASYDGQLLAVDPKNDLPLSICAPDAVDKGKCIVMRGADFYAVKKDFLDTKQKLIDCQKQALQN